MIKRNIVWQDTGVTQKVREKNNGHSAAVVWLTGLPSSGKSTIAKELQKDLLKRNVNVYVLDGDNIRHGLNKDLGFAREDRVENIRRIGEVARLFADAGFIVITAFISPFQKDRDNARRLLPEGGFIEVYVKAGVKVCEKRDVKGFYKKAKKGQIKDFTGVSMPYEVPENPEMVVNTEAQTVKDSVSHIVECLKNKGIVKG